jgi:hypothetical protein
MDNLPLPKPLPVETFRDLCIVAAEMRQYQKQYFQRGGIESLQRAKQYERRFDTLYERMIQGTDKVDMFS